MNKIKIILTSFLLSQIIGCGSEVTATAEVTKPASLTATGVLVSKESATVSPPSVSSMWQYKIQYLVKEFALRL
mgnify:CR=1 FL=1